MTGDTERAHVDPGGGEPGGRTLRPQQVAQAEHQHVGADHEPLRSLLHSRRRVQRGHRLRHRAQDRRSAQVRLESNDVTATVLLGVIRRQLPLYVSMA